MNVLHVILRVEVFLGLILGCIFARLLIQHWYPRERTLKFVAVDNDEIVMMRLKTAKGEVWLEFGAGLVDVHDAYDSLELLMKAGIKVHNEFPAQLEK